jgi:RimJ/RimL family protein N-acetyltransferase
MSGERFLVEWVMADARLRLVEPTTEEVRAHAATLAEFYNEPVNRALLTNEHEFEPEDVVDQFREMQEDGGHAFLLFADETMMGDCDLRHIEGASAELAIMVGARARQAKGFGTRFGTMLLAFGFGRLGLSRIFASVRPENAGSLRMLGKVGLVLDASPEARRFAEAEDDVCMRVEAGAFKRAHAHAMAAIRVTTRETSS